MIKDFQDAVDRMVAEHGEEFTRAYLKTYCEVVLDDPQTDDDTRTKILSVLEFLRESNEDAVN